MKTPTISKSLLGLAVISITLASCNMSQHYHRMRISHPAGSGPIAHETPEVHSAITAVVPAQETVNTAPTDTLQSMQTASQPIAVKTAAAKSSPVSSQPKAITAPVQKSRQTIVLVVDKKPTTKKQVRRLLAKYKIPLPGAGKAQKDNWGGAVLIIALVGGIIVALISGSAGAGVLASIGIALLIILGVAIGIALVIAFFFNILLNGNG